MNKKLLCAALLGGLCVAQAASAQEFDDRWYVAGSTGVNFQDSDRGTEDAIFATVGFGKFFTPNWSLDFELNYQNPDKTENPHLWWSQYGASADARYHFRNADRNWWPYIRMGLGLQRHEEEFVRDPALGPNPAQHSDNNIAANLGAGLQFDFGRTDLRTEIGTRIDFDDVQARPANQQEDYFTDLLASVGLTVALGPEAAPPPPPPAPAPEPEPEAPAPITIDLKGVNFDFDKSALRPDAVAILTEVVEILSRYPDLRVEVAGHTDLCGPDDYNQKLSERRASAVYDFLTSNAIDAGRLVGPVGYGESRPLEPTPQTMPQCKSETNRRTELNVQN